MSRGRGIRPGGADDQSAVPVVPGRTPRVRGDNGCGIERSSSGPTSIDAVAIVTGGSSGAGRELAGTLARQGFSVVVAYLGDPREADAVVDEILAAGATALAVRADVADQLDVERLFDETVTAFGAR